MSQLIVSWLTGELFAFLNKKNVSLAESKVTVKKIADLIDLISDEHYQIGKQKKF